MKIFKTSSQLFRKVIVWREFNEKWTKTYEYNAHDASVNSVCWAPNQYGLMFACASVCFNRGNPQLVISY
jgi:hypothetical protein